MHTKEVDWQSSQKGLHPSSIPSTSRLLIFHGSNSSCPPLLCPNHTIDALYNTSWIGLWHPSHGSCNVPARRTFAIFDCFVNGVNARDGDQTTVRGVAQCLLPLTSDIVKSLAVWARVVLSNADCSERYWSARGKRNYEWLESVGRWMEKIMNKILRRTRWPANSCIVRPNLSHRLYRSRRTRCMMCDVCGGLVICRGSWRMAIIGIAKLNRNRFSVFCNIMRTPWYVTIFWGLDDDDDPGATTMSADDAASSMVEKEKRNKTSPRILVFRRFTRYYNSVWAISQ